MKQQGLVPNAITYNALISACEKSQALPRALQLCADLQRRSIKPDIFTYSALTSACEKGQDLR